MEQLSFDFEAFNESLQIEKELIVTESGDYFFRRGVKSLLEIEEPLFQIKYPELNETGYTTSQEVIKTGQLRLEQAIARRKSMNCEYFLTWRDCLLIEAAKNTPRTESND